MTSLRKKRVAILATDGYEHSELNSPMQALQEAGALVHVIAPAGGSIKGWTNGDWHGSTLVDRTLDQARAQDYDALVLPGGVMNPDKLRQQKAAVYMVREFFAQRKPIAAICHAPWLLVEADVLRGRTVTSYASVKTDLVNAGAKWVDRDVVVDRGLVTSRGPEDLPAFNARMVEEIGADVHDGQPA